VRAGTAHDFIAFLSDHRHDAAADEDDFGLISPWTTLHALGGWKSTQPSQRWSPFGVTLIFGVRLADLFLRR
jgi:hypothetical protein